MRESPQKSLALSLPLPFDFSRGKRTTSPTDRWVRLPFTTSHGKAVGGVWVDLNTDDIGANFDHQSRVFALGCADGYITITITIGANIGPLQRRRRRRAQSHPIDPFNVTALILFPSFSLLVHLHRPSVSMALVCGPIVFVKQVSLPIRTTIRNGGNFGHKISRIIGASLNGA